MAEIILVFVVFAGRRKMIRECFKRVSKNKEMISIIN